MSRYILFASIFLMASPFLSGCGFFIMGEDYRIALFNPYVLGQEYEPFFYSSDYLHKGLNAQTGRDRRRNAAAWARELGNGASPEAAMELIYATTLEQWEAARAGAPDSLFQHNPAWAAFNASPDLTEYMIWAKSYENDEPVDQYWWMDQEEESTTTRQSQLKQQAESGYAKATAGTFLRKRWAYQLLLQAFYAEDAETLERLYTRNFANDTGVLADWARFHRANLDPEDPRNVVALATAFRVTPEKARRVYQRTPSELDPAVYLPYAAGDFERSNVYAFAAVKKPGRALELLREAYRLDPSNPVVPLLITREINKLEDWLMSFELAKMPPAVHKNFNDQEHWDRMYPVYSEQSEAYREENYRRDRAYLKELRAFLQTYKTDDALSALFEAHTALLDEDYATALSALPKMDKLSEAFMLQSSVIEYLATIQSPDKSTESIKLAIAEMLPRLEAMVQPGTNTNRSQQETDNFFYYYGDEQAAVTRRLALARIASQTLEEKGDTVAAYFMHNRSLPMVNAYAYSTRFYSLIDYLDREVSYTVLDEAIAMLEDTPANPFAKMIYQDHRVDVHAIRDVAGTVALRNNDLGKAHTYFCGIPANWHEDNYQYAAYLNQSPFSEFLQPALKFPGKAQLVKQMLDMEALAKLGGYRGAAACYDLARAWYDMSHLGESWMMLSYGQSSIYEPKAPVRWPFSELYAGVPHSEHDFDVAVKGSRVDDYLACAEATVNDPELVAKISYLKGLTQLRRFESFELEPYWNRLPHRMDSARHAAFDLFKENFATTRYYQSVAGQCSAIVNL